MREGPTIRCRRCGEYRTGGRHHVLPRTFWQGSGDIVYLCYECHSEIEKIYLFYEGRNPNGYRNKLEEQQYYNIFNNWVAPHYHTTTFE